MTPTVVGEVVYVGSCSGTYFAVDRESGDVLWSYDTKPDGGPAQFHGDCVVTKDLVISGSDSGDPPYTYAFDRTTGDVVWKREGGALESDLLLLDGVVVGRAWNGDLIGVSPADGERLWSVRPDDSLYKLGPDESLCALDGVVYVGAVDGRMYAVDPTDGTVVWKRSLGSRISTAPVVDDGVLCAGVADSLLHRISPADGRILATLRTAGRPRGRPVLAADALIVLVGSSALVAVDRELTEVRWSRDSGSEWTSPQLLSWDDVVVVGSREGDVVAYRTEDGEEAWRFAVDGVVRGLGADEKTLYVGTLAGTLYAVR